MANPTQSPSQKFYERYWRDPAAAPPADDPLREPRLALLLPQLASTDRVLDVGCGDGRATRVLAGRCRQVVGVDISPQALRAAKEGSVGGRWLCASLDGDLPFPDSSFDVVHCGEVIEHLLDVPGALRVLHRILRPGGLLFLSTPYHGLLKNLAIVLLGFERHFDPSGPHIRFFTLRSLSRLLREAGFVVERTRCLGRFWPVWMNLVVWARKE